MQSVELLISSGSIDRFASVLQSGIVIPAESGESLGVFLEKLPDFTAGYIADDVQTIFLDGTAIDNLETPLTGDSQVVALSAAMPGLSGAIFRRNSIHAALRTATGKECSDMGNNFSSKPILVTLKLFNAIARDKGSLLLKGGVVIKSKSVFDYLNARSWLLNYIRSVNSGRNEINAPKFLLDLLTESEWLHLTLKED